MPHHKVLMKRNIPRFLFSINKKYQERKLHNYRQFKLPYNSIIYFSQTYRSISVNNRPSPGSCVDNLPDSITLIPSLYARCLLTCIGTYNICKPLDLAFNQNNPEVVQEYETSIILGFDNIANRMRFRGSYGSC